MITHFSPLVTAKGAPSIPSKVCLCLSGTPKWKEGEGKLEGFVLFPMSVASTCQVSGKLRRAICLLEGRARS